MTITHIIYHIHDRKVGCTKNLADRKKRYLDYDGCVPDIEILEELHNKTDQEAGDIEWKWADNFGYRRGVHYTKSINAMQILTIEHRRLGGYRRAESLSSERRCEIAKMGGTKYVENNSPDKRSELARIGGLAIGSKNSPAAKKLECPHCGLVGGYMSMMRWHFGNCRYMEK